MTTRTYRPTTDFVAPPEEQGQIVQRSYALDAEAEVILCRETDYSDGSQTIVAFRYPDDDSEFQPWNVAPSLGRLIGPCIVTQDDQ
ncbi:MAG: hypothetical protein AB1651_18340 [Pseudomonadota bacterium]